MKEIIEKLEKVKNLVGHIMSKNEINDSDVIELHKIIKQNPDVELGMYYKGNTYDKDGITKSNGERLSYSLLYVNIKSPFRCFYFYDNGDKWNIDNDINDLKNTKYLLIRYDDNGYEYDDNYVSTANLAVSDSKEKLKEFAQKNESVKLEWDVTQTRTQEISDCCDEYCNPYHWYEIDTVKMV